MLLTHLGELLSKSGLGGGEHAVAWHRKSHRHFLIASMQCEFIPRLRCESCPSLALPRCQSGSQWQPDTMDTGTSWRCLGQTHASSHDLFSDLQTPNSPHRGQLARIKSEELLPWIDLADLAAKLESVCTVWSPGQGRYGVRAAVLRYQSNQDGGMYMDHDY